MNILNILNVFNILLQISGATCISDAVILAERFTPVTLAMFLLQEVEEETMLLRAIKTPTSTSTKPISTWRIAQVFSHGILVHNILIFIAKSRVQAESVTNLKQSAGVGSKLAK